MLPCISLLVEKNLICVWDFHELSDCVFFSQDCGNKLVESGCVSQEEVRGIQFYLIASVVDVFMNVNDAITNYQIKYVKECFRWTG